MSPRLPPGTRDVLPDEMRELRAITERLRLAFDTAGYGEVWTPALEYESVLRAGDADAAGAAYRTFDEHGELLALRSDMTIPIARMVGTRLRDDPGPLRLCYFAHTYRTVVRGSGQQRETLQGGIELIGAGGPKAEAEVVSLALSALDEAGLARHRAGIGDGSLYRDLLASLDVDPARQRELLGLLSRRDLVGLERGVEALGLAPSARDLLVRLPTLRGGPEVLERDPGPARGALDGLRGVYGELEAAGVANRVIFDLGLVRDLGYYTGSVFELYDPAVGFALGGGGRYDALAGRFGPDRPACGIALDIQRVHIAQAAEETLA